MFLTSPLLSKSLWGSLINKCRPSVGAAIHVGAVNSFSTSNTMYKSSTVEEKLGLPPRPKRPLTPYLRYMREMRPKFLADHPKVGTLEVVKALSKEWSKADSSLKARLQEEYQKEKSQYVEERMKYDAKLTEEQKAEIKQYKQEIVDMKERRLMRQRNKDLGKPKRPTSAYIRFMQRERVATPQRPDQSFREWHAKCTAKWLNIPKAEKEKYMQEVRKDIEKYQKDLAVWEEKMIKSGNVDVVRPSNLIDPPVPKKKKSKSLEQPKH